jgi:hypothetical protein
MSEEEKRPPALEIEVDPSWVYYALAALLVLLGTLGWLGKGVTPQGRGLLTWDEWQILRQRQAYAQQLAFLEKQTETLAVLLNARADPVRVQVVTERMRLELESGGLPALQPQRDAAAAAVASVRAWSLGQEDRDSAVKVLETATQALREAAAHE